MTMTATDTLRGLLYDAVADCHDAPSAQVGYVLSGGLDSSTVVSVAHGLGLRPVAFTGYYDEPGYDERAWARMVPAGRRYDVRITPEDFCGYFDLFAAAYTPPYEGMGAFGQFMVGHRMAQHGITVAVSGEGADELFGGYARIAIVAGRPAPEGYELYTLPAGYPDTLEAALEHEMEHLAALLLVDDKMMAAHGIETRAPFTDERVQAWALRLPARDRVGKSALRRAVLGIVPGTVLRRTRKMGFPIPLVQWANEHRGVRALVRERIGYLPDPALPWAREWFHELLAVV